MSDLYSKASLVMNPQLVDTGKVYSIKPEDRKGDFTFTRSSAATRVNADGLVEKETQNLLLQSNQFDTTWDDSSVITLTSGQTGYDGSSDAWKLAKGAASSFLYQSITTSGVNTFSLYAKADTTNWIMLQVSAIASVRTFFDLSNGVLGSSLSNVINAKIESIGNGWYRCSFTYNGNAGAVRVFPADGNNDTSGTSGSIYIQDAQLEQGLVARDYIETTTTAVEGGITDNVPRLDYTDSSCPALLLEPQRTNLIESSEFFDDGGYGFTNLNREAYSTISPEGVQNAYKLIPNTTNGVHLMTNTTSNNAVYSVFAKQGGYKRFRFNSGSSGDGFASYDLNLGQVVGSGGTYYIDSGIVDYGNGWYRCYLVLGATAGLTTTMAIEDNSGSVAFIGDGTSGIYVYGMQAEAGSYATSYIPTYGSSVTRVGETCGNAGNASTFNSTEGVLYAEIEALDNTGGLRLMQLSDGSNNNRVSLYYDGNSQAIYSNVVINNSANPLIHSITITDYIKVAVTWRENYFSLWVNGTEVSSDTNGSTFPANTLNVFNLSLNGIYPFLGNVKQIITFNTTLNNQELATLTTT